MHRRWLSRAQALIEAGTPAVLVRVIGTRGSAPRDAGTRMIVTADDCHGTIGGGHLEFRAIAEARAYLSVESADGMTVSDPESDPRAESEAGVGTDAEAEGRSDRPYHLHRYPLGASLGQCCGGLVQLLYEPLSRSNIPHLQFIETHLDAGETVVLCTQAQTPVAQGVTVVRQLLISATDRLGDARAFDAHTLQQAQSLLKGGPTGEARLPALQWLERLAPSESPLLIFGAGHVGKALITVLSTLPGEIRWVDARRNEFPDTLPDNVQPCLQEDPEDEIERAQPGSLVLVLTHDHALDERICAAALRHPHVAWCGLIGSASKRRRFLHRLRARGISDAALSRLCCPIGDPAMGSKYPGEIAISVAAQILALRQQATAERAPINTSSPTPQACLNS